MVYNDIMNLLPSKIKKILIIPLSLVSLGIVIVSIYVLIKSPEAALGLSCCIGPFGIIIFLITVWLLSSANKDELVEKQLERERNLKK